MKKILTIGDVVVDILPQTFPIDKKNILVDGETFIKGVTFQRGGCGGNFVCVLKSVFPEADVQFISRIGDDQNADLLEQEMEKYGVSYKFIRDPNVATQITIAVSYQDGERHFITSLGGLDTFTINDVPDNAFDGIDHLAYRGPWFAEKLLMDAHLLLKKAHIQGIPISVDIGFDPYWNKPKTDPKIQERKDALLKVLQYTTYLMGNEMEYLNLTSTTSLKDAFDVLFSNGVKNLVMHRGSKGMSLISLDEKTKRIIREDIPAKKIKVVNPVGSGDTFDSIFIAQTTEGKSIKEAAIYATAGAALSLQSPAGTRILMNDIKEIL